MRVKISNLTFHENPIHESCIFLCGQTDEHDEASSCYSLCSKSQNGLKIGRFLCIVIREVFWIEQRISKNGSLSYFRYRGEEMCWSSVNEISQTWLLTWGRKVSNFRNSAVCLECHTVEVQNSVTWSVIIPLPELFRKCASVTFRGPMADAVRWYHVPIPC